MKKHKLYLDLIDFFDFDRNRRGDQVTCGRGGYPDAEARMLHQTTSHGPADQAARQTSVSTDSSHILRCLGLITLRAFQPF